MHLRCTGLDNLFFGLVCEVGVRLEKGVRRLTGTTLPDVPSEPKLVSIHSRRRVRRFGKNST
jgi:hypothetical protein